MIYLAGDPSGELLDVQKTIEKLLSPYLAAKRSYRPHATLARVRKSRWQRLPRKPDLEKKLTLVEPVDRVALLESLVLDGRRRYEVLDSFALK
jgi:2'-5' RNA ligase